MKQIGLAFSFYNEDNKEFYPGSTYQNNGSNAIYSSVSTSQMEFPYESVLDYLAHEKALKACEGEWLVLHREVEKKMQEKEQESQDLGRKYIAKDGEPMEAKYSCVTAIVCTAIMYSKPGGPCPRILLSLEAA